MLGGGCLSRRGEQVWGDPVRDDDAGQQNEICGVEQVWVANGARRQGEGKEKGSARDVGESGQMCPGGGGQRLEATCGSARGGQGEEGGDSKGRKCVGDALLCGTDIVSIVFSVKRSPLCEGGDSSADGGADERSHPHDGVVEAQCNAGETKVNSLTVSRPSETVPTNLSI